MSDEDVMEMFTHVFSMILLKKRRKFLKLKHHDKNASLPHPNSLLLKNPNKARKREIKRQIKIEQSKLMKRETGKHQEETSNPYFAQFIKKSD